MRHFEGVVNTVRDPLPNPVRAPVAAEDNPYALRDAETGRPLSSSLAATDSGALAATQLQQRLTPNGGRLPRSNPNSRTSAGFPLAATAQQMAAVAQRKLDDRLAWEDRHEAAIESLRAQDAAEAERKELQRLRRDVGSPNAAAARAAQEALHKRQLRDPKIPWNERAAPPRPDFHEDPLTALASEHTGIYPHAITRSVGATRPTIPLPPRDEEPAAPEGSPERAAQRRRVNPLLDPLYVSKSDAAGLGYGRVHRSYFRYISTAPQVSPDSSSSSSSSDLAARASLEASGGAVRDESSLSGFRSKDGRGYRSEVRALGWGSPHEQYNQYVSTRRVDDVLKDYPQLSDNPRELERRLKKQW
jgi:hypothetical protein